MSTWFVAKTCQMLVEKLMIIHFSSLNIENTTYVSHAHNATRTKNWKHKMCAALTPKKNKLLWFQRKYSLIKCCSLLEIDMGVTTNRRCYQRIQWNRSKTPIGPPRKIVIPAKINLAENTISSHPQPIVIHDTIVVNSTIWRKSNRSNLCLKWRRCFKCLALLVNDIRPLMISSYYKLQSNTHHVTTHHWNSYSSEQLN